MTGFERAFASVERAAGFTLKSANNAVSGAKALTKATQNGDIAAMEHALENLDKAAADLRQKIADARNSWPFDRREEEEYLSAGYIDELRRVSAENELNVSRQGETLISFPSIVHVSAADRSVKVDRKKITAIRPSHLVKYLLKAQKSWRKPSAARSRRFLEGLYSVYTALTREEFPDAASANRTRVVPLVKIYETMTALPDVRRDYGRQDFARDLYMVDSEGPSATKNGARVSFPSATGTKSKKQVFSFVGPDGQPVEYFGVRFGGGKS